MKIPIEIEMSTLLPIQDLDWTPRGTCEYARCLGMNNEAVEFFFVGPRGERESGGDDGAGGLEGGGGGGEDARRRAGVEGAAVGMVSAGFLSCTVEGGFGGGGFGVTTVRTTTGGLESVDAELGGGGGLALIELGTIRCVWKLGRVYRVPKTPFCSRAVSLLVF